MAGTNCQPWSPMGQQKQAADARHVPYLVWCQEQLAHKHDMVLFENSVRFPVQLLESSFSKVFSCISIQVCPSDLGWPASRRRLYVFAFNRSRYRWMGPSPHLAEIEFFNLFQRRVMTSMDVFLGDTDDNIATRIQQVAAEQRCWIKPGGEPHVNPRDLLNPSSKRHYDEYQRIYRQGGCSEFVCDLNQNPLHRAVYATGLMPSMTTSLQRFSFSKGRFWTWNELYAVHGWPSLSEHSHGRNMPFELDMLSAAAASRLLGNGISLPVCAAFLGWCLSNLERVEGGAEGGDDVPEKRAKKPRAKRPT